MKNAGAIAFSDDGIPVANSRFMREAIITASKLGTYVATLSLCLAAGYDMTTAMKTANIAAGIVVKKIGTATLTIEELTQN